jgi:hypothetical protein
MQRRRKKGYVPAAASLNAYLGLADKEQSFTWLERAAEERSNMLMLLKVCILLDSLRGERRFAEYLLRANLSS